MANKKEMTAEEKELFKQRMAESREKKRSATEESEEIIALKKQLEELKRQALNNNANIARDYGNEKVHFLWQAEVADENILYLGENGRYGRIVGKTGELFVPKNELTNVLDEKIRWYIDNRWLLIVDGLTDEERKAYNAEYKEGEVLTKKEFADIVGMGEQIVERYKQLCKSNRDMVSKRFVEEYESGSNKITRDIVIKLNEMSKTEGKKSGDFVAIIEQMNAKDLG